MTEPVEKPVNKPTDTPKSLGKVVLHQALSTELGVRFTPGDITRLPTKARKAIGILLERLRTARTQTDTDFLTDLPNQRATIRRLEEMCLIRTAGNRDSQTYPPATIIEVDLNDFKIGVNYTYGEPIGDLLIRHAGRFMRKKLRKEDFIGRIGGDEFIIIMRGTTEEKARPKVEEILGELAQFPLMTDHHGKPTDIYTSACYGATLLKDGDTVTDIRERLKEDLETNKGLYYAREAAKAQGDHANIGSDTQFRAMMGRVERLHRETDGPPSTPGLP